MDDMVDVGGRKRHGNGNRPSGCQPRFFPKRLLALIYPCVQFLECRLLGLIRCDRKKSMIVIAVLENTHTVGA